MTKRTLSKIAAALLVSGMSFAAHADQGVTAYDELGAAYPLYHGGDVQTGPGTPDRSPAPVAQAYDEIGGGYTVFHGDGVQKAAAAAAPERTQPAMAQAYDEIGGGYQLFHGTERQLSEMTAARNRTSGSAAN